MTETCGRLELGRSRPNRSVGWEESIATAQVLRLLDFLVFQFLEIGFSGCKWGQLNRWCSLE